MLASWSDLIEFLDVYAHYAYNRRMSPEFDPKKNAANIAKHGVSLSTGDGVLRDPLGITIEDSSALDEQRWITVGANSGVIDGCSLDRAW